MVGEWRLSGMTHDFAHLECDLWDAVVIGAGVAGSMTAALLAARGARVLLVERSGWPRAKVCGGCISAAGRAVFEQAGLGDALERVGGSRFDQLRLAVGGRQVRLGLPPGVAAARDRLDAAMVDAATERGAAFVTQTTARLGPVEPTHHTVELERPDSRQTVRAKLVLAATGLTGSVGGAMERMPATVHRHARMGLGVVLDAMPRGYDTGAIHMACDRSGYVGITAVEDGRCDVAAAVDVEAVRQAGGPGRLAAAILNAAGLPEIDRLAQADWHGTGRLTRQRRRLGAARLLLIGDAAGYVEPFTGEGMTWAAASAMQVAPLASEAIDGWTDDLVERWTSTHRRTVRARQRGCRAVAWLLRRPVLVRGAIRGLQWFPGIGRTAAARLHGSTGRLIAPTPEPAP